MNNQLKSEAAPITHEYSINLKPCPFCGSEGKLTQKRSLETWIVECTNGSCPASYMIGYDYDTSEEAIEAWNRRADNA